MPDTGGRALDLALASAQYEPEHDAGFTRLVDVVRRRIWIFVIVAGAAFAIVALGTLLAQRRYTATALLQVNAREVNPLAQEAPAVVSGLPADSAVIDTETEVLRSRALAGSVVDSLDLMGDKEFNPDAGRPVASLQAALMRERTIDNLLASLDVSRLGLTHLIEVSFTSADPNKAARVADAFVEGYLLRQLETKYDVIAQTNAWLSHRLETLRREVETKERAAEEHRAANGLLTADGSSLNEQAIAALNGELVQARAALAEREARLTGLNDGADAAGEAMGSAVIVDLRRQQAEAARRRAELATRYGPRHPELQEAQREVADLQSRIDAETRRVVASVRNEVSIAERRVASIETSLRQARGDLASNNVDSVRQRELDRDAEASRKLYEGFLVRSRQVAEQGDLERADARIVSRATPPTDASSPKTGLNLGLGALFAFALGAGAIAAFEAFERAMRSGEDVQSRLGLACLGIIPFLSRADRRVDGELVTPETYVLRRPVSAFSESLRSLRAAVFHATPERSVRTLAVTSALPEEGKTTTAAGLARISALAGASVCLVDCDLRRRSATHAVGLQVEAGLTEVLLGAANLDDVIVKDPESSVHVVPLAQVEFTPRDLLGGHTMRSVLEALRARYDVVILDTAPVLPLSDTRVMSPFVDAVLMVVRWGKTSAGMVNEAIDQLRAHNARMAGVVLEGADDGLASRILYDPGSQYQELYKTYYLR